MSGTYTEKRWVEFKIKETQEEYIQLPRRFDLSFSGKLWPIRWNMNDDTNEWHLSVLEKHATRVRSILLELEIHPEE